MIYERHLPRVGVSEFSCDVCGAVTADPAATYERFAAAHAACTRREEQELRDLESLTPEDWALIAEMGVMA